MCYTHPVLRSHRSTPQFVAMACRANTAIATLDPMCMHIKLTIDGDHRAVAAMVVANTPRVEVGGV